MPTAREQALALIARIPEPGLLPEVKELALMIADAVDVIAERVAAIERIKEAAIPAVPSEPAEPADPYWYPTQDKP